MMITAAGLATQRSSVIAWNKSSGEALSPVLSWQDRREYHWLKNLEEHAAEIRQRTGLRLTPHYGASKLRWLIRNNNMVQAAAENGTLVMGPLAAFIVADLVRQRQPLVDHANASRTQLWSMLTGDWDEELLELFELRREWLPDIRPIRSGYGSLSGTDIPLTAVNGDQTAAIHADGPIDPGDLLVNLGTGAFVLKPTGDRIVGHDRLLSGLSDSSNGEKRWQIEGTVNGAGAALKWATNHAGLDTSPAAVTAALERQPDPDLLFLNSVGGLGSPWWIGGPSPHWCELSGQRVESPDSDNAISAVIESILFLVMKNIETIRESGLKIDRIRISGGLSNQNRICQMLADLGNTPVLRTNQPEATARCIAWLALGKPGNWIPGETRAFKPATNESLSRRYALFQALLENFETC